MRVLANQHSPVLRRVGVLVDLVRDELAETRVVGKPLARRTANGVPADVNRAGVDVGQWARRRGDDVGRLAESGGALERQLAVREVLFDKRLALGQTLLATR